MNTKTYLPTRLILSVLGVGLLMLLLAPRVEAKDVRYALLVGNEQGWKGDPALQYVMNGDIYPLASLLRGIGFTVKIVKNAKPETLRKALQDVKDRVTRSPRVTTFLFYYTGHADKEYLHMGRKGRSPMGYKEFVRFLRTLPVKRRIAFFDACFSGEIIRQFGSLSRYKELIRKGASGYRSIDISKTIPHQGDEKGLQVITSSADYAWESRRYKASVFTHHMLRGLRGRADRDKDGKISVDELFNYVSDSMVQDIRQKPQMFGVFQRSRPYALAPAYQSQLHIGSNVVGTLQVSVKNFVWKSKKEQRQPLQLSVVHGWGTVELKKGRRCWKQRVYLPKGGKARLLHRWEKVSCQKVAYTRKGSLLLPAQLVRPSLPMELELNTGFWSSPITSTDLPMFGGELGLRWKYFGVFAEVWGGQRSFENTTWDQLYTGLRFEGGYSGAWGPWQLFAGGYVGAGMYWQQLNIDPNAAGLLFRYGIALAPAFALTSDWSIAIRAHAGFTLGQFVDQLRHEFDGGVRLALRYGF